MAKNTIRSAAKDVGSFLTEVYDIPNMRLASGITNRDKQIMTWLLPNSTTVQMYINPESFVISETKQIQPIRTKGGFVVQYWGDNLTRLTLQGTTGSAGVKGINILRDIYHAENRAFEVIAASQTNQLIEELHKQKLSDVNIGQQVIPAISKTLREKNFLLRPSLASLAVGITLFYQGIQYRGFFNTMTVTEDINRLGLFTYNIEFMATDIFGRRNNFMPWHREAIADDVTGQILNALASKAGNAIRGFFGLSPQQNTPEIFHPENSPPSFGGNSFAAQAGLINY